VKRRVTYKKRALSVRVMSRALATQRKKKVLLSVSEAFKKAKGSSRTSSERNTMKAVDINALVAKYYDTGLYLAVSEDRKSVVGTGKTIQDAVEEAAHHGHSEPIVMRAPSRKSLEDGLHF
jgi:hypothetical protein